MCARARELAAQNALMKPRLRNRLRLGDVARRRRGARAGDSAEACGFSLLRLAHLADVMLGIKFEAELGHEIELGLGGLLIKRADISAARSEALLDRKCFSRPPLSAAAPGAPSRG